MDKQYDITILNGTGTANVFDGQYAVGANVTGYNNTSINPSELNIVDGTNEYGLTISADGTLTLHVTETGETTGTAVVGAKFIRCDSEGNEYGNEITTDLSGNAVFQYVPYAASGAPLIYYKQTSSDDSHLFDGSLQSISLEESTKTKEVTNPLPALRTFTLTDANYEGLSIVSGTITLS